MSDANRYIAPDLIDEFLYSKLKNEGFSIDLDDYVVTAQIIQDKDIEKYDAEKVKSVLSALICRNEDEQKRFYVLFDAFLQQKDDEVLRRESDEISIREEISKTKLKKIIRFTIIGVLIALFAFAAIFFFIPLSKTSPLNENNIKTSLIFPKQQHLVTGDSVQLAVKSAFPANQGFGIKQTLYQKYFRPLLDTTGFATTWNLQDTIVANRQEVSYAFKEPGVKKLGVKINKPDGSSKFVNDSITICDSLPTVIFDQAYKGKKTVFKISNPKNRPVSWKIDDQVVKGTNQELSYQFDSAKVYNLNCRYVDQFCPHDILSNIAVSVLADSQFSVSNVQSGNINPVITEKLKNLFYWLYDIIGVALILMMLTYNIPSMYKGYENNQFAINKIIYGRKETQYLKDVDVPEFKGRKAPIDIQFNDKNKLIRGKEYIVKLAFDLKRKIESDQYYLNLKKTSLATIKNLGMFTPVLQNKSSKRSYLVLIDKSHEKNMAVKLFQYLVAQLLAHQVDLDIYYYHKSPLRVFKKHIDDSVNVNYLKNRYHQSILIVFGNGEGFIDSILPEINFQVEKDFSPWSSRLLLTPNPVKDWSIEEKILASFFHVLPADNIGLLKTVEVLLKKEYLQLKDIEALQNYSVKFIEFDEIDALEYYLSDERILQWIAGMALYPKVTWEIILAIGSELADELVTYENLLKICRIEWVQKGVFPSRIRLELLKRLTIDNEIIARAALVKLLQEEAEAEEGSFAGNERRLQLIINKFILYTDDPQKFIAYEAAEKEFLQLYNQDKLLDIPLHIYLKGIDPDKKLDTWENTLREKDNSTDNLKAYSNQKLGVIPDEDIRKKIRTNLFQVIMLLSFLFTALTIVGFIKPNFSMLVDANPKTINDWKIVFKKDSCYKIFNPSRLVISDGTNKISDTSFGDKDTIRFKNLTKVIGKELNFTFISASGDEASSAILVSGSQINLQIAGNCTEVIPGSQVYIRYYPEEMRDSTAIFQSQLLKERYTVDNTLDRELTAKSEIKYALDSDRDRATKVAADASLFFKQKIQAVKVESTLKNQIEVWVLGNLLPTIVNIQYNDISQKTIATALKGKLQKSGYKVEQSVQGEFDWDNEIRYYDDRKKDEAIAILKIVRNGTFGTMTTKKMQLSLPEKDKNIIKIWLKNMQDPASCKSSISANGGTIYFSAKQKKLSAESQNILNQLTKRLMDSQNSIVSLRGFSNSEKAAMQNLVQAKNFANAIKTYLVNNGIAASSISTVANNDEKRAVNQVACYNRVVISISTRSSTKEQSKKMPDGKY
ncbi:MAG: hypothetical protein EOO86_09450 [Pedobacter sp.]|nr:MAG: hypothetical protein EOO86_09450 [Pedobacter sp.]